VALGPREILCVYRGRSVDPWRGYLLLYRNFNGTRASHRCGDCGSCLREEAARVDEASLGDVSAGWISLRPENSVQEFSEIFAIYLKNYRDVAIMIGGERIDPAMAIAKTWALSLAAIDDEDGNVYPAALEVIERRRQTKRAPYLCNEQGFRYPN
jgi:hypothetical protein